MKPVILNNQLNKNNLWNGCILASVAHAIMVAHYPELSYEHSWDGKNYSVVDGSGGRGTITFNEKYVVGAFRNENINRTEFPTAMDFFTGAPHEILELAKNETLEYLLEEDEDGMSSPSITTAFWGDNDTITSIDNFVRLIQYGGYLLERQFMEHESAIESWRDYYEMTTEQVDLLKSIYARKVNNPDVNITLTKRDIEMIGAESPEGLSESMTSFEEIGIVWEK
ncbi:hypothetical protein O0555_08315 [Brevibacillus laterosporus]|uniref:Uncharacterized protein n=1 Tax=Brevibacillus laterosporus TaxID=1465 RepID=A0AAP3GA42_BRELA|nr:hypothetical protein [Brevibacillus laterosporus]MBG9796343.1 hypothetical protein [Brevibacillus laterosporus]MCR8937354.1 hypothetical protein [Brevibacillus laterosporus]MCR8979562.1 hypothetical protein [Brevibacillus laterosporus]MCZ0806717.1 hypothetical protein [Brevibacillus laterosporus]MCZ0828497.1 hypothetical protein [Brevibacillus laterosporus]